MPKGIRILSSTCISFNKIHKSLGWDVIVCLNQNIYENQSFNYSGGFALRAVHFGG